METKAGCTIGKKKLPFPEAISCFSLPSPSLFLVFVHLSVSGPRSVPISPRDTSNRVPLATIPSSSLTHTYKDAGHPSALQPFAQAMPARCSPRRGYLVGFCTNHRPPCCLWCLPMACYTDALPRTSDSTLPMSRSPTTKAPRTLRLVVPCTLASEFSCMTSACT